MSNTDEILITRTTYSPLAIMGWVGVLLGLVAGVLQLWQPSAVGIAFLAIGLIAGGVTVSFAGPVKRTTRHWVKLNRANRPANK